MGCAFTSSDTIQTPTLADLSGDMLLMLLAWFTRRASSHSFSLAISVVRSTLCVCAHCIMNSYKGNDGAPIEKSQVSGDGERERETSFFLPTWPPAWGSPLSRPTSLGPSVAAPAAACWGA